ncbi:hypothetical protein PQG02_30955 (plasmid) [Nostoc sp. UHCC 0926]|uniref:hypothetical protein n=1 Tax=Nostoc sp. UHCC 0926 TaxID=3025190 RepID=UPI00235EBC50|nr:hypothetical protein [Nostoc sp. UHCC 0926]WDD35938.1 hypothetical protein PQG02_30955 [Nostoc sp. UHCC 0926]
MSNKSIVEVEKSAFLSWLGDILNIHSSSPHWLQFSIVIVYYIILYAFAAIGAVIPYFFDTNKKQEDGVLIKRLQKLYPNKTEPFYALLELMITVFIGGFVGIILIQPTTPQQAFASGLGWFATITSSFGSKNEEK